MVTRPPSPSSAAARAPRPPLAHPRLWDKIPAYYVTSFKKQSRLLHRQRHTILICFEISERALLAEAFSREDRIGIYLATSGNFITWRLLPPRECQDQGTESEIEIEVGVSGDVNDERIHSIYMRAEMRTKARI
ncbi:hypothetical protein EVAR_86368_1 [Eumeta japonica]|uniref:Uncharacterized protein n=1 Tax=Eumeta variegata TaxID=151549 RepID=A0A4C1YCV2_EUMVA|nr:hypothetical protein EVAR_86368_1 [Eumeta japonica]